MRRIPESWHLLFVVLAMLAGCYQITFQAIPGEPPVKQFSVTRLDGNVSEIFVKVDDGVRLESLVDHSYFEGARFGMSLEMATNRFGPPQSQRTDATMNKTVYLYQIPKGELGLMAVPGSGVTEHQVWAYPTNQSPAAIILNESLRAQLAKVLPAEWIIRVHILRDVGSGGVTLNMNKDRVASLILGPRDGRPPQ